MISADILIDRKTYSQLLKHLLPRRPQAEEAGFGFARYETNPTAKVILLEWTAAKAADFKFRSLYGIELTDECRARTIKRAHDLKASIIEFHSHPLSKT